MMLIGIAGKSSCLLWGLSARNIPATIVQSVCFILTFIVLEVFNPLLRIFGLFAIFSRTSEEFCFFRSFFGFIDLFIIAYRTAFSFNSVVT